MERDHFRDMLRLTLVRALALYWLQFEAFIRSRTTAIPQALPVLQNVYPRVHAVAVQPAQATDPALAGNFQATYQPIAAEFINLALGLPPARNRRGRRSTTSSPLPRTHSLKRTRPDGA